MSDSAHFRAYRESHREDLKKKSSEYYQRNAEVIKKRVRIRRSQHPLLDVHSSMLKRCGQRGGATEKTNRLYGERGIRVCDEWLRFANFEKWAMEHGWKRGLQIDRIDNDGNYEPSNCRIVTCRENAYHKSTTRYVVYKGRKMCVTEAMRVAGTKILRHAVYVRLNKGWSVADALETTARKKKGTR